MMNNEHSSLIDQANYGLEAAKADLDMHAAELEAAQSRYNDAKSRYNDAMQRFLEADLLRVCRWNQMVSYLLDFAFMQLIFLLIIHMFCLLHIISTTDSCNGKKTTTVILSCKRQRIHPMM